MIVNGKNFWAPPPPVKYKQINTTEVLLCRRLLYARGAQVPRYDILEDPATGHFEAQVSGRIRHLPSFLAHAHPILIISKDLKNWEDLLLNTVAA